MFISLFLMETVLVTWLLFDNKVVELSHGGKIKGIVLRSTEGKPFFAFRGIPYAEPPIGDLRFKEPIPKSGWKGEPFDATIDGAVCVQHNRYSLIGVEDCLMLNVYTSELPKEENVTKPRAVMVFVHGGSFFEGDGTSNTYSPQNVMDFDVVLVTINYRLDTLGFLSTGDSSSPGNYGMLDQRLALLWVKDNIAAFGGDPGSVTLIGHSAGAASVSYHLLSPLSKGLFHRAIVMSGSSLCVWAYEPHPLDRARYIAKVVGCPEEPTKELVDCLRTKPAYDLVLGIDHYEDPLTIPFTPTIDGYFLPDHPRTMNSSENINNIPVMTGVTEAESGMEVIWPYKFGENGTIMSDKYINLEFSIALADNDEEIIEMVKDRYLSQVNSSDGFAFAQALTKAISHGSYVMPHYEEVKLLSKAGLPVYAYSYNYVAEAWITLMFPDNIHFNAPSHAEDLNLMFDVKEFGKIDWTEMDKRMAKTLSRIHTNFAQTGNPDPNNEFHPHWKLSTSDVIHIQNLDLEITSKAYAINDDELYSFWTRDIPLARSAKQKKMIK